MSFSIEILYEDFKNSAGVCIDSRNIKDNQLFFALKGERVDGNSFVEEALKKNVIKVVMSNEDVYKNLSHDVKDKVFLVKDTLTILQELAIFHRKTFSIPVIAIGGSNGKTTTKELLREVLSKKYKVYATEGNLNNDVGLPLSILRITKDIEIAVIELGANHIGEIANLCLIAQPTHGLITNIGKAHIGEFGSLDGVLKGEGELFDYLSEHNGSYFLNEEDIRLVKKTQNKPQIIKATYNRSLADGIENELPGEHNKQNMAAALVVGRFFGVDEVLIKEAISAYKPTLGRSEWKLWLSNKVFYDAYNANPSSMAVALETFVSLKNLEKWPKMAILGDMKELGTYTTTEHATVVEQVEAYIEQGKLQKAIFVGLDFENVAKSMETDCETTLFFSTLEDLKFYFDKLGYPKGETIFMKGSRGMKLETILNWN